MTTRTPIGIHRPHQLTAELVRSLLDFNPETGDFVWKINRSRACIGSIAGTRDPRGYKKIGIGHCLHLSHRLAWLHFYGDLPSGVIDHINCDKGDNRICNLRVVPQELNAQNQRNPRSDNKSGLLGVSWSKSRNKWLAQLQHRKRNIRIGYFNTAEEAHAAYIEAKRATHAGCTL